MPIVKTGVLDLDFMFDIEEDEEIPRGNTRGRRLQRVEHVQWKRIRADRDDTHGRFIEGIIGRRSDFNAGSGIQGVNSVSNLVLRPYMPIYSLASGRWKTAASVGTMIMYDYADMIQRNPSMWGLNISAGYNWWRHTPPINPDTNGRAQELANLHGS